MPHPEQMCTSGLPRPLEQALLIMGARGRGRSLPGRAMTASLAGSGGGGLLGDKILHFLAAPLCPDDTIFPHTLQCIPYRLLWLEIGSDLLSV